MTHLCYVYIKDYEDRIKDTELVIDCHYNYKYDKEKKTLQISDNKDFPDNFWGKNIYSITGFVGENGAGKTTAIRFLLKLLGEGYVNASVNCFAIYQIDKFFKVYTQEDITVFYNNQRLENNNIRSNIFQIPCFYYTGHFSPYVNNSPTEESISGFYNASDSVLLEKDYEEYYNKNSMQLNWPLYNYLNSHVAQNNYRICMMLANNELSNIIKGFIWPQYVIIYANRSGGTTLRESGATIPEYRSNKYGSDIDHYLSILIYHNLINIINDRTDIFDKNDNNKYSIIEQWQNSVRDGSPIMDQFNNFINKTKDIQKKKLLNSIYDVLRELIIITEHSHNNRNDIFLYINCKKDAKNLITLGNKILKNDIFLTSKFFDIYFSKSLDKNTLLSSGEQEFLNLFSRIYDAFYLKKIKFKDRQQIPRLIMLDEAEIGFHPDWQRKYLNLVIEFLDKLKEIDPQLPDFQIIISTHSPILLSDIPKCCTNYLKQGPDGKTINVSKEEIGETFAANVFDLYRMSFFMKNGLVGEFSRKKIQELNSKISKRRKKGIINEINMIGDERIQEYLMDKYQKRHPEDDLLKEEIINYYKGKINNLTTTNKKRKKDE